MFTCKFENYRNDFDKNYFTKSFYSLEDLKRYLIKENEDRDPTPRSSKYWRNPARAGVDQTPSGQRPYGWYRTERTTSTYSLWLKQVEYDGKIVFEEFNYCSPKFNEFLMGLKNELDNMQPVYGDF